MRKVWTPDQSQYERNPNGAIILDGVEVAHTVQCCHCNKHYVSVKGSGQIRGLCLRCGGKTCGDPGCNVCIPYERAMEQQEQAAKLGSLS